MQNYFESKHAGKVIDNSIDKIVNDEFASKSDYLITKSKVVDMETSKMDADDTYTKLQIDEKLIEKASLSALTNKVDKETGKSLIADAVLAQLFRNVTYNSANGEMTFTRQDNTTVTVDLPLELIVTDGTYNHETRHLILTLANGETIDIPVGDLLTDIYTESEVDALLSYKANSADVYNKTQMDVALGEKSDKISTYTKTETDTLLSNKVSTEPGKGLSEEDFTTEHLERLNSLAVIKKGSLSAGDIMINPEYLIPNKIYQIDDFYSGGRYIGAALAIVGEYAETTGYPFLYVITREGMFEFEYNAEFGDYDYPVRSSMNFTTDDKSKLSGIQPGATKNDTDANLKNRANHTGTQAISTVTNLQATLDNKVDKLAGEGLTPEKFTAAEKSKLSGIAAGAQVNTIESIKVDGTAIPITSKVVNIDLSKKANSADVYDKSSIDNLLDKKLDKEFNFTDWGSASESLNKTLDFKQIYKAKLTGTNAVSLNIEVPDMSHTERFEFELDLEIICTQIPSLSISIGSHVDATMTLDTIHTISHIKFATYDHGVTWTAEQIYYSRIMDFIETSDGIWELQGYTYQNGTPAPDLPAPILNTYPAGAYKTNYGGIINLSEPLRGLGEYRDKITYNNETGEKVLTRNAGRRILNGSESWTGYQAYTNTYRMSVIIPDAKGRSYFENTCKMERFAANFTNNFTTDVEGAGNGDSTSRLFIGINKARLNGWSDGLSNTEKTNLFKAWLSVNNTELVYQLAAPTTQQL